MQGWFFSLSVFSIYVKGGYLSDKERVRQRRVLPWGAEEHSAEKDAEENDTKDLQIKKNWKHVGLQDKSPRSCANH